MLHILPNMPSFDIINKAPLLHPAHKVQPQPHLLSSNTDVSSLTLAILLQTLVNSSLLSQSQSQSTAVPTTFIHHTPEKTASPPLPSPLQLSQFLKYAETPWCVQHYHV